MLVGSVACGSKGEEEPEDVRVAGVCDETGGRGEVSTDAAGNVTGIRCCVGEECSPPPELGACTYCPDLEVEWLTQSGPVNIPAYPGCIISNVESQGGLWAYHYNREPNQPCALLETGTLGGPLYENNFDSLYWDNRGSCMLSVEQVAVADQPSQCATGVDLPSECGAGLCGGDPNTGPSGAAAGEPVELRFGSFYEHVEGLSIPGAGPALETNLRYSSRQALADVRLGEAGPGWTTSYSRRLLLAGAESGRRQVWLLGEDGRANRYVETTAGSNRYEIFAAEDATDLTQDPTSGRWTFRDRSGRIDEFDGAGALRRVTDRVGNRIGIIERTEGADLIQQLTSSATGLALERVYRALPSGQTRLVEIRDAATNVGPGDAAAPRRVRLSYDERGRLVEVRDAADVPIRIEYDELDRIVRIEDRNFDPEHPQHGPLVNTYEGETARVASQRMSNGVELDFEWFDAPTSDGITLEVTYAGQTADDVWVRAFLHDDQQRIVREYAENSSSAYTLREYDEDTGRLIRVTDADGRATRWRYAPSTRDLEQVIEGEGTPDEARWSFSNHDGFGQPGVLTDPTGMRETRSYDVWTGLLRERSRHGAGEEVRTTRFTYDFAGRLMSIDAPEGLRTAIERDGRGRIRRVIRGTGPNAPVFDREYDFRGVLVRSVDDNGVERRFETDAAGRTVAIVTDPAGAADRTTLTYDGRGNVTTITEADGAVWERAFVEAGDTFDRPSHLVDPTGARTEFAYDALGRIVQETLVAGGPGGSDRITRYRYATTDQGMSVERTDADGAVSVTILDAAMRPTQTRDARGVVTRSTYDPLGRLVQEVVGASDVDGSIAVAATSTMAYDRAGRLVSVLNPSGVARTLAYDAYGELSTVRDVAGRTMRIVRDPVARSVTTISEAPGLPSTTIRRISDDAGRLISVVLDPDGVASTTTVSYGETLGRGLPSAVSGPDGRVTTFEYDGRGFQTATVRADGSRFSFDRNARGQVVREVAPNGRERAHRYDAAGRLVELVETGEGESRSRQWAWTVAGQTARFVEFDGQTTSYAYDAVGRLIGIDEGGDGTSETSFAYLANGLLSQMTDPNGSTSYGYDAANRMTSRARDGRIVAYTRRPDGEVTTLDYAGLGQVQATYDDAGLLRGLDRFGVTVNYGFGARGELREAIATEASARWTHATGVGRLQGTTYDVAGAVFEQTALGYEPAGRIVERTDGQGVHRFGYDGVGRLASVDYGDAAPFIDTAFEYDVVGNRVQAGAETRSHDLFDRIDGFSYDAAGRLVDDGRTQYAYDARGRLSRTTQSGRIVEYRYDGRDRLIGFSVDGRFVELVLDERGPLPRVLAAVTDGDERLFVWGPEGLSGVRHNGVFERTLVGPDGSIRHVVGAGGQLLRSCSHDAYGGSAAGQSACMPDYGPDYRGQWRNPDGTIFMNARVYHPGHGTFLTADQYLGTTLQPESLHRYAYAHNDPINYFDPSGYSAAPFGDIGVPDLLTPLARPGDVECYGNECFAWDDEGDLEPFPFAPIDPIGQAILEAPAELVAGGLGSVLRQGTAGLADDVILPSGTVTFGAGAGNLVPRMSDEVREIADRVMKPQFAIDACSIAIACATSPLVGPVDPLVPPSLPRNLQPKAVEELPLSPTRGANGRPPPWWAPDEPVSAPPIGGEPRSSGAAL